jgi:hypothetical protein
MPPIKKPTGYDLSVFQSLEEPIRIDIRRKDRVNGGTTPIPLPQEVWSKDDAGKIEEIVLNDISGGGTYKAQMTDNAGKKMEWEFTFSEQQYPPRVPQQMQAATARNSGPPSWQPPSYVPPAPGWSAANPMGGSYGYLPPGPPTSQPPTYYSPSPYVSPYQPPPPWYQPAHRDEGQGREVERLRMEAMATEHRREREAAEARHAQEIGAVQAEMRRLAESQQQRRPEDDPAIVAMRENNARLERELERQRADQAAADREARAQARLDALLTQMQRDAEQRERAVQAQLAALQQTIQQMTAAPRGPDPTVQLLLEAQRSSAEASREQARLQAEAVKEAARYQAEAAKEQARMSADQPTRMLDMVERVTRANGGQEMLAKVGAAYDGALQMGQRIIEMSAQLNPPTNSPVVDLIGNAMAQAKEVLDQYIRAKRDGEVAQAQVAAAQARAQGRVAAAYAMPPQGEAAPANWGQAPDGSYPMPPPQRAQVGPGDPAAAAATATAPAFSVIDGGKPKAPPPKEADLFGPAYAYVLQLRDAVKRGDLGPDEVAQFIIKAAIELEEKQIIVPAYVALQEQRYADFMDLVLPGVPSEFQARAIVALQRLILSANEGDGPTVAEGTEDGDDDDEVDDSVGAGGADDGGKAG